MNQLLKKFNKKFVNWKYSFFNQAGGCFLLKFSLISLPIYWFQFHKIPKGVLSTIDKTKGEFFFWEESNEDGKLVNKKIHLMKWKELCTPKHKGGLGLDKDSRNPAMLLKWWWTWYSDRGNFWWNTIQQKYSLQLNGGLEQSQNSNSLSSIMRDICSPNNHHQYSSRFNKKSFKWKIGNKDCIHFLGRKTGIK